MDTPTPPVSSPESSAPETPRKCPVGWRGRMGTLGAVAFTFFLVKGLLWLTVPAVLAYFATK